MNINDLFALGNIIPQKGIQVTRLERIKREGSPPYPWNVPATGPTATATIHVPTQFPQSRKYEPLDYIEVVNLETTINLILTINNSETFPVPAGGIRTLKGQGLALWTVALTNTHAADTTTLNNIRVTLMREPLTIDRWAQNYRG